MAARLKKTIGISIGVFFAPFFASAHAVDWSARSTLSESVEFNDNLFLRTNLAGGTFASYSTITANATARTPTSFFTFDGNLNYRKYWGGLTEGQQSEGRSGAANLHYETKGKTLGDRNYLDASFNRQSAAFALLGELGIVTRGIGFLDSTAVGGGIERAPTANDSFSLSARATYRSYDPSGGGISFTDVSASGSWQHRLNSIASLTASTNAEFLDYNNALNSSLAIYTENAGVNLALSPLLSFRGTAGVAFFEAENGAPGVSSSPLTATAPNGSSSSNGFVTNMTLIYKMYQDLTVTLTGSKNTSPTLVGSLVERTSIGGNATHQVNSRTSISLSVDASRQTTTGTTSEFVSTSISSNYKLTRDWTAQLSYRHLERLGSSGLQAVIINPLIGIPIVSGIGPTSSNSFLLVVSRDVDLLPSGN